MTRQRPKTLTPRSHYALLLLVPLGPVAAALGWNSGVDFFEPVHGVPALVCYFLCGLSTMGFTLAFVGRESNRIVALIGFSSGLIASLAFELWTGWRSFLFRWEPIGFAIAAVLVPVWISYSFRTLQQPEERAPGLDDDLF
tara:strand:+ start:35 stop:457 length:423 start_codon:yes stop_codon:yes gene_type:complete